ncbi:MAG: hypothetical protein UT58_C0011G0026 [Microgenomates group bacterium GW2011_GWC1_39_7b]|uniref:DUF5667 domain-containing protein n=3 Tax=Candidatus Woeseibacteriota TaxID=1752722 RepID=A0A0G0P238_9BACT|nr:MAG: hypothetical protein UT17_C0003G0172 [Candidatus Woesebacteria bacterium GW2011_GWB1_39_10]KKR26527.1 MAG: hypothetical protein UT58_C0011G0026 [Microgenomates group bacterium GW2011_GWC1_39_7b]KKR73585.1 MAG: hypothetical protein UU16_C0018G0010 [Candidatus Woesebacteria bacterium GW2011_GWA2_40_7]KKS91109.1 MAG: hypothetical protein UV66_C0001G0466 [Candidatus Woesebacteria bacterium GW2011_GWA1_43_12]
MALCALYFVLCTRAQAQTFDFNKAYQDHLYSLTLYNQAYSDYQDAKNSYLANKTLSLKEDARQKTLNMLKVRDQMMTVYMQMLKQKIVEDKGLGTDDINNIFVKIDSEIDWYKSDKEKYNTNDSLETLFGRSEEARARYKTNTLLTIDEALVDIGLGEEIALRNKHEAVYSTLKTAIDAGVATGKLTLNPFNHWLTDIDATDSMLKQNESDVRTRIQKIYNQSYSPQGSFEASIEILGLGIPQLSQFNKFLVEVLNYIKNQQ